VVRKVESGESKDRCLSWRDGHSMPGKKGNELAHRTRQTPTFNVLSVMTAFSSAIRCVCTRRKTAWIILLQTVMRLTTCAR
jgi:hypothetical protein